jgi:hypothetical protein
MADDLILYSAGQQISIRAMMSTALAPFRLFDELDDAFESARGARDLVKVEKGKFVALQLATTKEARFRVHCDAHEAIDWMPPGDAIKGHFLSIKKAITTKPSDQDIGLLLSKFVDVLQIKPGSQVDDYVEALSWKLSECPRQRAETHFRRRRPYMPVPAIAAAINFFWDTYSSKYGRPPDIPDVLNECGKHTDRLIDLYDRVDNLGRTQARLGMIIKATEDSYPDADWGDEPEPSNY